MYKVITTTLLITTLSVGILFPKAVTAETVKYKSTLSGSTVIKKSKMNPALGPLKDQLMSDGATLLNKDQVAKHLSGNTQQWSNGGAYYHNSGRLDFIWEGKSFNDYTWRVVDEGKVCIKNPDGFTTSCSLYFDYKDSVWTVVTEEFGEKRDFFGGPDTILLGDRLSDLEPWDPAMSGK